MGLSRVSQTRAYPGHPAYGEAFNPRSSAKSAARVLPANISLDPVKHRIIHVLQKYLLNPPIKLLLALGIAPPGYALLETIGRKTGQPRRTPVGDGRVGRQFWIVAEHGRQAAYVRNLAANPRVRVRVRNGLRMKWLTGTAVLLPDDDPRERQRWLARERPGSSSNAAVVRMMGTELLTVRIDLEESQS